MSEETYQELVRIINHEEIVSAELTREEIIEIYQEIERLNNIIEEYKNANEYHQNIIHELETMKQPNQLHSENVKLRAENKKLDNIINEMEKELDLNLPFKVVGVRHLKKKLQELKKL